MDDKELKAFDISVEVTKQLIGIATAILTISFSFANQLLEQEIVGMRFCLVTLWILSFLSIVFGLLTSMKFAGNLVNKNPDGIYEKAATVLAKIQIFSFVGSLVVILIWGSIFAFKGSGKGNKTIILKTRTFFGADTTSYNDSIKVKIDINQVK